MISARLRLAAVLLGVCAAACGTPPPRPPVVLFVIDTLRADRVGLYGYAKPTTPNLDALAAESVVFERAIAPAPWTLPSVVSVLTATWPCEHGVLVDGQRVRPQLETLAERLRSLGYRTLSLHANEYAGDVSGLARGYEVARYVPHTDGALVAPLLDRLGTRFFLYVHNVEPHDGYVAPRGMVQPFGRVRGRERARVNRLLLRLRKLTRADFEAGRAPGSTDNGAEQERVMDALRALGPAHSALYDGDVRLADARLGSVVATLRARGLWDETLFIALSDHGEELGEHGGFQHDHSVYEELLHVPLLIHFPGGQFAGRRVPDPVSLVDVTPTVLDVLGEPLPEGPGRGRSLLGLLRDGAEEEASLAPAVRIDRKKHLPAFEGSRGNVNVALRDGSWKGIWNAEPDRLELYDLAGDPGETRDLSAAQPERARSLRSAAADWLAACRARGEVAGAAPPGAIDPQSRERLRALGYAE